MAAIARQLESLLTPQQVMGWEQLESALQSQIQGAIAASSSLPCAVYPQSEDELAGVISCAHKNCWRVLLMGQASKLSWGGLAPGIDVVISMARLNRLLSHAVGDLVVTAEAGLAFARLQATLRATQQFLPLDPICCHQATLGGIVATADTGALRQRYGGVRDLLIGLRFVRHDGQIARAGGNVVKNVAGYDLMKLLTGSYGSLAAISQVTFRTYPLPETSQTVLVTGELAAIAQICQTIKASVLTPVSLDLLSAELVAALEYTAAAGLAVRLQTIQAGVAAQVEQLTALGQKLGLQTHSLTADADSHFWQQIQTVLWPGADDRLTALGCKLGVPPASAAVVLAVIEQLNQASGVQAMGRLHAGSGLGTLRLTGAIAAETVLQLRSRCEALGGFLTLLQAPAELKEQIDTWGYTGSALEIMCQLKQQFDPRQILSAGRFVGGL
ncbi:MAG: FAD-binding oxidoreductase [Leptolyngbyaceae cyanobacterium SL_1_1]|nr:FAD-binding oxidoreductase [Leptolyngbyaceae cyanobacterium RM2_2_21]NJN01163.1 FAD-binding oxidoreductase [Leptolyngbyaceae cyanobacterium RM1_1_2]NJO09258.1 FAD-binding oxidoreductase [Leptolyngbyaceae cyanobacterium SL_1_1]